MHSYSCSNVFASVLIPTHGVARALVQCHMKKKTILIEKQQQKEKWGLMHKVAAYLSQCFIC